MKVTFVSAEHEDLYLGRCIVTNAGSAVPCTLLWMWGASSYTSLHPVQYWKQSLL